MTTGTDIMNRPGAVRIAGLLAGRFLPALLAVCSDALVCGGCAAAVDLPVGEPLVAKITFANGGQERLFRVELKGSKDESLSITRNGQDAPAPSLRIQNRDGTYDQTFPLKYG